MPYTVLDLITDALAEIGVASPGETVSTEDRTYGLGKLNRMISSWTAEKLAVFGVKVTDFSATGAEMYTFGSGGSGSSVRPTAVIAVAVVSSGRAQAAKLVDADAYNAILDKSRQGVFAEHAYFDGGFPLSTLYLTPKPSGGSIRIHSVQPITAYAAVTENVVVPPGYERALVSNLAVDLAPAYGRPVDQTLAALAASSKMVVATLSAEIQAGGATALAQMAAQHQGAQ